MPIEENRAVARRVLDDLVGQGRLEVVDQIYAQVFEFVIRRQGRRSRRIKACGT